MEAARAFHRCLFQVITYSSRCPHAATASTEKLLVNRSIRHAKGTLLLPSIRTFSSSVPRRSNVATEPQPGAAPQVTSAMPASPIEARQALEGYLASVQKIINTHDLKRKLAPRDYERVLVAIATAEAQLGAQNQMQESFEPMFNSVKEQVGPILQKNFNTTDVEVIAERAPDPSPSQSQSQKPQTAGSFTPRSSPPKPKQRVSLSNLMDGIIEPRFSRRPAATSESRSSTQGRDSSDTIDVLSDIYGSMGPKAASSIPSNSRQVSLSLNDSILRTDREFALNRRSTLRLKPTLGRTRDVAASFDVTRAFRALESACGRNSVRNDEKSQRFHVRRGQRRKDLRRSRWRVMFKAGFVAECERVRRMWRQGW